VFVQDLLREIRSKATTWASEHSPRFAGWTMDQARKLMGSRQDPEAKAVYAALPIRSYAHMDMAIPTTFDERTNWPKCTIMTEVRDQAACGVRLPRTLHGILCGFAVLDYPALMAAFLMVSVPAHFLAFVVAGRSLAGHSALSRPSTTAGACLPTARHLMRT
jgi:hypothetical protein